MKTANYNGILVHISMMSNDGRYALVSKSEVLDKLFKVDLVDLSNFNTKTSNQKM